MDKQRNPLPPDPCLPRPPQGAPGEAHDLQTDPSAVGDPLRRARTGSVDPYATSSDELAPVDPKLSRACVNSAMPTNPVDARVDLSPCSQADLNRIALQLSQRPRQTLAFRQRAEVLTESVALTGRARSST